MDRRLFANQRSSDTTIERSASEIHTQTILDDRDAEECITGIQLHHFLDTKPRDKEDPVDTEKRREGFTSPESRFSLSLKGTRVKQSIREVAEIRPNTPVTANHQ
jgi:hypothetical protein